MSGLAEGVRLGMAIRQNRENRKRQEERDVHYREDRLDRKRYNQQVQGMQAKESQWREEDRTRRIKAEDFANSIKQDLLSRNLKREELQALSQMSQIQDVISSKIPREHKDAFLSKVPEYMNKLHGAEMNAAGPDDLEQSFADVDESEEGLTWTLDNKDKKTGKSYKAPMTWGRTRGGKDVAVQPWDLVYGQIKAYREVAEELGIYDPKVMQEISGIGLGEKKKSFSAIGQDPNTELYGQYGEDGKFTPITGQKKPGGSEKTPAAVATVQWVQENISGADGEEMTSREAWDFAKQATSDRKGFIATQMAKELEQLTVMGLEEDKAAYKADPQALENQLIQKYDRIWQQIDQSMPKDVQGMQAMQAGGRVEDEGDGLGGRKPPKLPDPQKYSGKTIRDRESGKHYKSDGSAWQEVER